jgi:CRP-like cAMP-binding protein
VTATAEPPPRRHYRADREATKRTPKNVAVAAEVLKDDRCRPTHAEIAKVLGCCRSAVTRLIARFVATLDAEQRARWDALQRRPKRRGSMVQGSAAGVA